jgi:FkbM family methyltransferase
MYSQYGECQFILKHFSGRIGRFLDVGSYDGLTYSNTRCLMEAGWSGICVEPNPLILPYLAAHTEMFPLVATLKSAIVPDDYKSQPRMWVTQDALSTFVPENLARINRNNPEVHFIKALVPVLKWHEFLAINPEPYDFINIDVEGWNWELLRDGPLAEMVCIEMDPQREVSRMKEHFRIFGLTNQKEIGGNLLAWR